MANQDLAQGWIVTAVAVPAAFDSNGFARIDRRSKPGVERQQPRGIVPAHGSREQVSVLKYLSTGDFVEATFENWESEFLQMGMYVVLTAFLYQRGSSESKPLNEPAPQDQDPRQATANQSTPWPVRRGVGS